jgi:hypothetical protein
MSTILVSKELGGDIVTREHGKRLRELVEKSLASGPVVVDFEGLQITSVSFFDEAFGQLAGRYGETLLEVVQLERIDPFDLELLRDIVRSRAREARKRAARG